MKDTVEQLGLWSLVLFLGITWWVGVDEVDTLRRVLGEAVAHLQAVLESEGGSLGEVRARERGRQFLRQLGKCDES